MHTIVGEEYKGRLADTPENRQLLAKAYLRRGLAYEHTENLKQARMDFKRVKMLDPSNLQSSQGLHRVTPHLPADTHDYMHEQLMTSPLERLVQETSDKNIK